MRPAGQHDIISYAPFRTRLGLIWAAWTPRGICRLSFRSRTGKGFAADLRRLFPGANFIRRSAAGAPDPLARELTDYCAGRAGRFTVPIDLSGLTPFSRSVLEATANVPFGAVASYGEIAAAIGNPGSSRAVGNALGGNPVPILIPCHRVIASGGRIGGFTGGLRAKRKLLAVEGVRL